MAPVCYPVRDPEQGASEETPMAEMQWASALADSMAKAAAEEKIHLAYFWALG
jgi:hypothetical protein